MNKTLLPPPPKRHANMLKIGHHFYILQFGPKDVIEVQFHSAVKKNDEFLFSKCFPLRSVELCEGLVD
jgi:hypothetical protein